MLKTEQLKGKSVLIHGTEDTVSQMMISSAVKLQRQDKVVFIDTINCFTKSYVARYYHKKLKEPMDRIFISRPAKPNELIHFIYRLDQLFAKTNMKVLMISSVNSLFAEMHNKELMQIFPELIKNLNYLTKKYDLITIIGNISDPNKNSEEINKILSRNIEKIYGV